MEFGNFKLSIIVYKTNLLYVNSIIYICEYKILSMMLAKNELNFIQKDHTGISWVYSRDTITTYNSNQQVNHINRMNNKKHIVIPIKAGKALYNTQYS